MSYSRRDFARITATAALPISRLLAAKDINSKVAGVRLGVQDRKSVV